MTEPAPDPPRRPVFSEAAAERPPVATMYLHPGQFFASSQPTAVTTILGSCVAVCLWDPIGKIGGMNHFLLPYWTEEGHSSPRFGSDAIQLLIEALLELGAQRRGIQAKVFGGACVLGAFQHDEDHLGARNVRVALRVLDEERIPILQQDAGGRNGRKLVFQTDNGAVRLKTL